MSRLLQSLLTGLLVAPGLVTSALAASAPQTVWSTTLKVPVYNTPQERDGEVYLTSTQSSGANVFAIDGSTGKPLWSFPTQGSIAIPPTVGPTQVFVASDVGNTHFMRAIDAKTGALIWKYTRDQPPECMCSYPSTLTGGLLFAQTDGHSLYAFAPSGAAPSKRLWSFDGDGALLTKPVAADGVVVVGSSDRHVYGLDAQTGKQVWNFGASGAIDDAAVTTGSVAYVVSEDHNLYALNIKNGQTIWQYTMDDYAEHAPILLGRLVVVDNRAGQLLGLDAAKGGLRWKTDLDDTPFSSPLAWQGGKGVVLKIGDHKIGAFDTSSGKPIWQYGTEAVVTLPIVSGDHVNVATSTGEVMALD